MRVFPAPWLAIALVACAACGGAEDRCSPECGDGAVCRYDACVPEPTACANNLECSGDRYCDVGARECLPWGVGPGGDHDAACLRRPAPGVFFPQTQCEWLGPPAGDPYPAHVNVLATPAVAALDRDPAAAPSIVFVSYNGVDDSAVSCAGSQPADFYGVIRVISGRDCAHQATIASQKILGSTSVAVADLGGDPTPEIVAARIGGGLIAFTLLAGRWEIMWETASTFAQSACNWGGPSIHDLDDDGVPEILLFGGVFDAGGNVLDARPELLNDALGTGYVPVIADLDGNGRVEMVTGGRVYSWAPALRRWEPMQEIQHQFGATAVADFGTFPEGGQDARGQLDGIAEVVSVVNDVVKVSTTLVPSQPANLPAREVFSASLAGGTGTDGKGSNGGMPAIADFDGDGRAEIGVASVNGYQVLDLDCRGTPDPATCPSLRTDGIAWVVDALRDDSGAAFTGSAAFDFDGDGRAEAVSGDQCFTRIFDGRTGTVLASRARTSCTYYEHPLVVDADADFNAELVTTHNRCPSIACPAIDPLFDGAACEDDWDCPAASPCRRDQPSDAAGRCRCVEDADCGAGYACADPIAGPAVAGRVCRAAHPQIGLAGVRVLADQPDRWGSARPIWNQHAFSVTHVDAAGRIPRTSQWATNWTQRGLNDFRTNVPADGVAIDALPDLTVRSAVPSCVDGAAAIAVEVCNRGTQPVGAGLPVAGHAETGELGCQTATAAPLAPGACATVSCPWTGPSGAGFVAVDDRGNNWGSDRECREDNNQLAISVGCR